MRAILCEEPGRLALVDRPEPRPGEGEVLVRIRRAGVCGTDFHIFRGKQPYLSYPRVIGHELAGEVVEVPPGSALRPVAGRLERLGGGDAPLVVVDYAHTPDALEKALAALAPLPRARGGPRRCVLGGGGNRHPAPRPTSRAHSGPVRPGAPRCARGFAPCCGGSPRPGCG